MGPGVERAGAFELGSVSAPAPGSTNPPLPLRRGPVAHDPPGRREFGCEGRQLGCVVAVRERRDAGAGAGPLRRRGRGQRWSQAPAHRRRGRSPASSSTIRGPREPQAAARDKPSHCSLGTSQIESRQRRQLSPPKPDMDASLSSPRSGVHGATSLREVDALVASPWASFAPTQR